MQYLLAVTLLLASAGAADAATDPAACQTRQTELSTKIREYSGDPMLKRLMQADLDRATTELIEGDADECMAALDHAAKLLSGNI
jgi:hypothetical protein